eukprot:gb/GFBE01011904.1/.p1 GENE.gb/GFBE01011904.1/~~gb/GFBE01011904.1/.p1  ORF type:complete len:299 (+),score=49.53 gb/GFBE01011904.1/:1-897(+)
MQALEGDGDFFSVFGQRVQVKNTFLDGFVDESAAFHVQQERKTCPEFSLQSYDWAQESCSTDTPDSLEFRTMSFSDESPPLLEPPRIDNFAPTDTRRADGKYNINALLKSLRDWQPSLGVTPELETARPLQGELPLPPERGTNKLCFPRGSAHHKSGSKGLCTPCPLFWQPFGCADGRECKYCHICVAPAPTKPSDADLADGGGLSSAGQQPLPCNPEQLKQQRALHPELFEEHARGVCRPCAWVWKPEGCRKGEQCRHCHLCPEDAVKMRRKIKRQNLKKQTSGTEEGIGDMPQVSV